MDNKNECLNKAKELHVGSDVVDSRADLCIYAEDINIQQLTSLIGCEPTKTHLTGDVFKRNPFVSHWSMVFRTP